jgi:hypothetical protein
MLFLVSVAVGILIGYLARGRLSNLGHLRLRGLWLVLVALLLQVLIFPLFTDRPIIPVGTAALHIVSYVLLFAFLMVNVFRIRPLLLVGLGAVLNLLVISVNGGHMPASVAALEKAGATDVVVALEEAPVYGNIVRMGDSTSLDALGDVLYIPAGFPLARTFSVGDVLVMVGLVWLTVSGMRQHE